MQHCEQLESCTLCPPLKLLRATFRASVAEVESAPTFAKSRATVSPCVHYLQHCVQLRDAILRAMMHRLSAPLTKSIRVIILFFFSIFRKHTAHGKTKLTSLDSTRVSRLMPL